MPKFLNHLPCGRVSLQPLKQDKDDAASGSGLSGQRRRCLVPVAQVGPAAHLAGSGLQNSSSRTHLATNAVLAPPMTSVEEPLHLGREPVGVDEAEELAQEALMWSSIHGLLVGDRLGEGTGSTPGIGLIHAPIALLPTPFPASAFHQAYHLAPLMNDLVDAVSLDADFLHSTLANAAKTDTFTAALLDIHAKSLSHGLQSQVLRLGMHRSDYMVDSVGGGVLQVELNTIASSFPGLSSQVSKLHRHLAAWQDRPHSPDQLPANRAAEGMAEALALAWEVQGDRRGVVLMVVQPGERNLYDQCRIEDKLWSLHGVRTVRRSLREIADRGRLHERSGTLTIDGHRVTVAYFRAGYGPDDYPSSKEWEARLLLERSSAVCCPNVAYHLAGTKKVQQKLAEPGVLERFVPNSAAAAQIRGCFAGQWALEGEEEQEGGERAGGGVASSQATPRGGIIQEALEHPDKFVLKPQREGGGNNIYGEDVRAKLLELLSGDGSHAEDGKARAEQRNALAAYILMQRIFPPVHRTLLLRRTRWEWADTVSELGIYSTYLRRGADIILNKAAGHLLRTKPATSDEGGVATGFAVLDSPLLVNC